MLRSALGSIALLLAACSSGTTRDFLGPDPRGTSVALVSIDVVPGSADLKPGAPLTFRVTGVTAGGVPAPSILVDWTATGGTISSAGEFVAAQAGEYWVTARVRSQPSVTDSARVAVFDSELEPLLLSLNPDTSEVPAGDPVRIRLSARLANGQVVTSIPGVTWEASGGTIDTTGVFAAPAAGEYQIKATAKNGVKGDTEVTVLPASTTLTGIEISPRSATLLPGEQVGLSVRGIWSKGSGGGTKPNVAWTAEGGTISAEGSYTAGAVPGIYLVRAVEQGGGLRDSIQVAILRPTVTLTSLVLNPAAATLGAGETRLFSATGLYSDGSQGPAPVSWTATGGAMTPGGIYTAGSVGGTFQVTARALGAAVADTSVVTIQGPVTAQVTVAPSSVEVFAGGSRQFAVSGVLTDGNTVTPAVVWTATGGSVSPGGLYTAGSSEGTFRVIARAVDSEAADTAVVTVVPAAPPAAAVVTGFSVAPAAVTLPAGGIHQFTSTATWSDGQSRAVSVSYTAGGGTLSPNGLYTAGPQAGTFLLVALCGCGVTDTAAITIEAAPAATPATLTQLAISPAQASLAAGGTLQFSVIGTMSDGSATTPAVTWSATGGTISSAGLYAAGATTGSFQVSVLHAGTGLTAQRSVAVTEAQAWLPVEPELPRATVDISWPALSGKTITVASGGNLQSAINSAACGDEIVLSAGAVFTGSFTLPNKGCTKYIVIRGGGATPPMGTRVTPATAAGFPKILAPGGNESPIKVTNGAGYYRLTGIEVTAPTSVTSLNTLIWLHNGSATSVSQLPHHIILDRMYIHGHATMALTRCVMMNSGSTAVVDSYLDDCHGKGFDSQAIVGWAGPGPYLIENNFLAGAGENVMFGGADPSVSGLIPSDIVVRGNHFFKPTEWKGLWSVKNIFEIKNAQRVLLEGNVFENNWVDAQAGDAIVLNSSNQGNTAPWSTGSDITMRSNLVRNTPRAINIAADPNTFPVVPAARIKIENNIFENIGSFNGTTGGFAFTILGAKSGLRDIQFVRNTGVSNVTGSLMQFDGSKESERFLVLDNHFALGAFGIKGSGTGSGTTALDTYFRTHRVQTNAFETTASVANAYPSGNFFIVPGGSVSSFIGSNGKTPGADEAGVSLLTQRALSGIR